MHTHTHTDDMKKKRGESCELKKQKKNTVHCRCNRYIIQRERERVEREKRREELPTVTTAIKAEKKERRQK